MTKDEAETVIADVLSRRGYRVKDRYPTGEVALVLGVSRETARGMAAREQVEAVQTAGGHWRIPHGELVRLVVRAWCRG